MTTRRRFLATSALTLSAATYNAAAQQPNERIRLAVMGVRGRGRQLINGFSPLENAEIVAVVDPDENVVPDAIRNLTRRPAVQTDIRRTLEDRNIDALIVAAPDHWIVSSLKTKFKFVVGDPRQAIFGFRGGDPRHLALFCTSPLWVANKLTLNFRSATEIVRAANRLALHFKEPYDQMRPTSEEEGDVSLYHSFNPGIQSARIVEKLRDLVNLQLPGIALKPLPVAPRQIPFHAGFNYFEMDRSGEMWKQLEKSGGLAMHIAGEFPGLEMECWAIRS